MKYTSFLSSTGLSLFIHPAVFALPPPAPSLGVVVFGGLPPLTLPLPLPLPSGTIARFTGLGSGNCHSEGMEYISSPRCGCRHCETLLSVIYHCHLLPMVTEYLRSVFLSRHHGRCCWPLPLPLPLPSYLSITGCEATANSEVTIYLSAPPCNNTALALAARWHYPGVSYRRSISPFRSLPRSFANSRAIVMGN